MDTNSMIRLAGTHILEAMYLLRAEYEANGDPRVLGMHRLTREAARAVMEVVDPENVPRLTTAMDILRAFEDSFLLPQTTPEAPAKRD